MGAKNRKQVLWTDEMDEALLKEVVRLGPYEVGHGKVTATWTKAALAMHDYDPNITGRACQARCDLLLEEFAQGNRDSLRVSGVDEDEDDLVKLKQDVQDRRDDAKDRRTKKRELEVERLEELESAGERACSEAEERVAKRLSKSPGVRATTKADASVDPIEQLMTLERKRHDDDHAYRMERLAFEREEQEHRRNDQKLMTMLLEKLINKLGS
ncbi:Aste57867_15016 [Aphanomyces stellatus]|uniref:Aste57867_15016 protein n=1 Tax=Aphanomyces stellatus TaxID=120398 RepID=A0A485L3Y6_9STRA|nr:hypothetical protein As57867_014960 [Aphanomyces stellatus]VFT91830.1 Aste57867_15016 [Aphanomyces stellatus]